MRFGGQKAFTIVELLIVIVVIGILAAITIVAFNGVQNRAHDTAVQSDLSNMAKQLQAYHAVKGRYPTSSEFLSGPDMTNLKVTKTAYNTTGYNMYYCTDKDTGERFGLAARSQSGTTYTLSSASSMTQTGGAGPSWGTSCGAFGESTLANIEFTYGWHRDTQAWRGVFAD